VDDGAVRGTLTDRSNSTIPAVGITLGQGLELLEYADAVGPLSSSITLISSTSSSYSYMTGTSMAAPHVAGIAALVWSWHPDCTNQEIRSALLDTARDVGGDGWDQSSGYGIIQARAALDHLDEHGCEGER
jgi:serine protease